MNEDSLIRLLLAQWTSRKDLVIGPGDDCAAVRSNNKAELILMKVDTVVENVHFTLDMPAAKVGRKALARVVSDFAAMGTTPTAVVVSITVPERLPSEFLRSAYRGMNLMARKLDIALAGGETTSGRDLTFTVAGIGFGKRSELVLRSTAFAGDAIFVTGTLGGSFKSQHHLNFHPRLKEAHWLATQRYASAMMDISDGIGKDLPRLAHASELSFRVDPLALPRRRGCTLEQAVNDGEDYELLFTVSQKDIAALKLEWPFHTRLSEIGRMLPEEYEPETGGLIFAGFDHFA